MRLCGWLPVSMKDQCHGAITVICGALKKRRLSGAARKSLSTNVTWSVCRDRPTTPTVHRVVLYDYFEVAFELRTFQLDNKLIN
jgi:hypothetical protein